MDEDRGQRSLFVVTVVKKLVLQNRSSSFNDSNPFLPNKHHVNEVELKNCESLHNLSMSIVIKTEKNTRFTYSTMVFIRI